jgi:hypothetical protein
MEKSEWFKTNKGLCIAAARITTGTAALLSTAVIDDVLGS